MALVSIRIVLPPACRNQTPNPSETNKSPKRAPRARKGRGKIPERDGRVRGSAGESSELTSRSIRVGSARIWDSQRCEKPQRGEGNQGMLRASPNVRLQVACNCHVGQVLGQRRWDPPAARGACKGRSLSAVRSER